MFKETLSPEEKEKQIETKVILEFMRHGQKESDPKKSNEDLRLTKEGRVQADAKGKELNPQTQVAVGKGSPRPRTHETAYRAMLANENIAPDATLEEIEAAISKELKVGKKMITDERLNFINSGPIGKESTQAFNEGRYLTYMVNESDKKAIETQDTESSTYTRQAGNIAEIISLYIKIGGNFNRIASKTDKYEEFGNRLERYLGTHTGVAESFVAKVLEKTEGIKKRDEFVESVGGGFKETQGIQVEIINKGEEQQIQVSYKFDGKEETLEIDQDLLKEIIWDRKKFEEAIKKEEND